MLVLSEVIRIVEVKSTEPGEVERPEAELLGLDTRTVNGSIILTLVTAIETAIDDILAAPVLASIVGVEVELPLEIVRNPMIDMV